MDGTRKKFYWGQPTTCISNMPAKTTFEYVFKVLRSNSSKQLWKTLEFVAFHLISVLSFFVNLIQKIFLLHLKNWTTFSHFFLVILGPCCCSASDSYDVFWYGEETVEAAIILSTSSSCRKLLLYRDCWCWTICCCWFLYLLLRYRNRWVAKAQWSNMSSSQKPLHCRWLHVCNQFRLRRGTSKVQLSKTPVAKFCRNKCYEQFSQISVLLQWGNDPSFKSLCALRT